MPSPLASLYVYGRYHCELIGYPTICRAWPLVLPLFVMRIRDFPVLGSMTRLRVLLLKCEPVSSTSHPSRRASHSCAVICASCPQPCVEPMLSRGLSCDAADDGASATLI